ncbi:MAG: hypothetical protein ABIQ10_08960, partial [Gemmatimonadaceae bacterium]
MLIANREPARKDVNPSSGIHERNEEPLKEDLANSQNLGAIESHSFDARKQIEADAEQLATRLIRIRIRTYFNPHVLRRPHRLLHHVSRSRRSTRSSGATKIVSDRCTSTSPGAPPFALRTYFR